MERIRLDIIPKGLMPVCHASQYDDGRVIRLDLMDGLQGYSLTDEEIELDVRKPDGHIVTASVDVVAGNTFVDIVTTEQMCAVEGENICELKISKDGAEIYSLNFRMMVEKSVTEGGDPSESFIHNLNQQIYDAVADQYEGNVIFDDVPTANHGTPYTVTSEGIKNAISEATPDNLSDLNDVSISSPSSNQALVWDAENNRWTNGEVSTVGSIDDLDDVDTTGKASGDSLRYDGNEWVAKPTTITLTQAEYNALQTKEPNTHYVITDAPNLNPTASDIEYSSGVSVKQAIDSKQDKYWKKLSNAFELTGNATGTWSFTDDLSTSKYTDIMFCISLVSDDSGVRSSMSLSRLGFEAYGVFYDYTIGSDRMYFQLSKATNNSFTISSTNLGGISSRVFVTAYYR